MRGAPLRALGYEWLAPPHGRYGIGLLWRCTTHDNGSAHKVTVYFLNPTDGGDAIRPSGALGVWQYGGAPATFTFVTSGGNDVLDFGPCGRVRVIEGWVEPVS